jgi:hypothetical protein
VPVLEFRLEPDEPEDEVGSGVVPETIGLAVVAPVVVIFVSLHSDIDAAARSEHAAI